MILQPQGPPPAEGRAGSGGGGGRERRAARPRGGAASNGKGPAVGAALPRPPRAAAAGPQAPRGYAVGRRRVLTFEVERDVRERRQGHARAARRGGGARNARPPRRRGRSCDVPGQHGRIGCFLTELSRSPPPPLPGGYAVGEKVYFTGRTTRARTAKRRAARAGGQGDRARDVLDPAAGKGLTSCFGQQGQHQLLPRHAQPLAAAAAAGSVRRRRREGVGAGSASRSTPATSSRTGGRAGGRDPRRRECRRRQGLARHVPGQQGKHQLLPHHALSSPPAPPLPGGRRREGGFTGPPFADGPGPRTGRPAC